MLTFGYVSPQQYDVGVEWVNVMDLLNFNTMIYYH